MRLRLVGTASNRDGIGARATVRVGKATASRVVRTGSSYLSQSELPLTFGLGTAAKADEVIDRLAERQARRRSARSTAGTTR